MWSGKTIAVCSPIFTLLFFVQGVNNTNMVTKMHLQNFYLLFAVFSQVARLIFSQCIICLSIMANLFTSNLFANVLTPMCITMEFLLSTKFFKANL